MSLLTVLGYTSLLRSTLEHCWLSARRAGAVTVGVQPVSASQALASTLDLVSDSAEKAAMDMRNQFQSVLLLQDEAIVWTRRIRRALVH